MKYLFTCKDCGSHDLDVVHEYEFVTQHTDVLPCTCGAAEDGIAARTSWEKVQAFQESGPLDDDHHWEYEEPEEIDTQEEEGDLEVFCAGCLAEAEDWEEESHEAKIDEGESNQFFVHCAMCNREIEFGWSHPDRAGRIWPAECSDFNPWLSWPEPRYRESWAAKRWLRPGDA